MNDFLQIVRKILSNFQSFQIDTKIDLSGENNGNEKNYSSLYSLNLRTFTWSIQKARGEAVKPRDEPTACVKEENSLMIIFGGFCAGERTN